MENFFNWMSYLSLGVFIAPTGFYLLGKISLDQFYVWLIASTVLSMIGNIGFIIIYISQGNVTQTGLSFLFLAINVWFLIWVWRRWRKGKDKIRKALGAKSKALRDKLVKELKKLNWKPRIRVAPQPALSTTSVMTS